MHIINIFGEEIEVTDLQKAIAQCESLSDSPFAISHYQLEYKALPADIKVTVGQYNSHALGELNKLITKHEITRLPQTESSTDTSSV